MFLTTTTRASEPLMETEQKMSTILKTDCLSHVFKQKYQHLLIPASQMSNQIIYLSLKGPFKENQLNPT